MKKLMAANWKMHKTATEAEETAREVVRLLDGKLAGDRSVLIFPPFTAIQAVAAVLSGRPGYYWGGQNFHPKDEGAFTGEVSPEMLLDLGCSYALAGHSERRWVFGESDELVGEKVAFGLQKGLRMVLCIGEKLEERKADKVEEVISRQLEAGLAGVNEDVAPESLAVAYEPVWAIGTGEVAGPEEISEAHTQTRVKLRELLGNTADQIPILYGGSVKPANAEQIMELDNVDGVLVGGASLAADSFSGIVPA
ncbi:triose-phosphate isomerase [Desulfohalovibrio reitneri]|uniref:triose-phosphate isomerase n=1 Tax=Desulfohalovibrio reitneri TaxID=1307759 RepID=UPI0004A6AC23|nr:triose-phosphate isomerase [Desulfohalovibrio reitneri]